MNLKESLNQKITITGTAYLAKAGAMVLTEEEQPIYISGMDDWPDDYSGSIVEVTGVLRKGKLVPDPTIGEDGGISCGAFGDDYYLTDVSYSMID